MKFLKELDAKNKTKNLEHDLRVEAFNWCEGGDLNPYERSAH